MMKRALLPVLSLVVLCLLLEVVLRTTHLFHARLSWTEPDREIGWRFTPGREYWFSGENDHAITGRINSIGCRDRERTAQKPARVRRIAVLGDSFVEAFQVELDSTFVAITERSLNAQGRGEWEVMNFGRSGMTQSEELIVLERDILPLAPDVVLLVFAPVNDIADINPVTAPDTGRPFFRRVSSDSLTLDLSFAQRRSFRMREAINPLKQRSALISLALERYNALRLARSTQRTGAAPSAEGMTREQTLCTARPDSMYAVNYELCKQLITRMARACKSRGIQFVVTGVPLVYEDRAIASLRAMDATFLPDSFDRDLGELARSEGFAAVPLVIAFNERSREIGKRLNWAHWNYSGHRTVAEAVTPALARIGTEKVSDSF